MDKQQAGKRSIWSAFGDDDGEDMPTLPENGDDSILGVMGFVPARSSDAASEKVQAAELDGLLDRLQDGLRVPKGLRTKRAAASSKSPADDAVSIDGFIARRLGRAWTYYRVGSTVPAFEARRAEIRMASLDDDAIVAAMLVARTKWGSFRPSGPPQFLARCEALARQHGISMQGDVVGPVPRRCAPEAQPAQPPSDAGSPGRAVRRDDDADASQRPVAVPDGNRERMYFRDLLVDAGVNLRSIGLTWTGDRDAELSGGLDAKARSDALALAARAGLDTLRVDGSEIRVVEASAARDVLREACSEVESSGDRNEGLGGAVRVLGYALGRYGHALGVTEWDDAQALVPPTLPRDPEIETALRGGWTTALGDAGVIDDSASKHSSASPGPK